MSEPAQGGRGTDDAWHPLHPLVREYVHTHMYTFSKIRFIWCLFAGNNGYYVCRGSLHGRSGVGGTSEASSVNGTKKFSPVELEERAKRVP